MLRLTTLALVATIFASLIGCDETKQHEAAEPKISVKSEEKRIPVDAMELDPSKCSITFYQDDEIGIFAYISLGLKPFDSGLGYPEPPETTHFDLESVVLGDVDLDEIEGREFKYSNENKDMIDGSIYLNAAHNPVDVLSLRFLEVSDERIKVDIRLFCNFEFEMVARNETLEFSADLEVQSAEADEG